MAKKTLEDLKTFLETQLNQPADFPAQLAGFLEDAGPDLDGVKEFMASRQHDPSTLRTQLYEHFTAEKPHESASSRILTKLRGRKGSAEGADV